MILNNALLLVLLVLAVAAGWTLGRGGLRMDGADRAQLPSLYYRGFIFLLDGEEDDAEDEAAVDHVPLAPHERVGARDRAARAEKGEARCPVADKERDCATRQGGGRRQLACFKSADQGFARAPSTH